MNFRPQELIPGALEPRASLSTATPTLAAVTVMPLMRAAPVDDRERLEREREGGGAPSERNGAASRTILARLFHLIVRRSPPV
jgi:hypothetical protein